MTPKLKKIGGKMYRALKVGETILKSDVDSYGYPSDYIGYEMDSYTLPVYRPIKSPAKKGKVVKSVKAWAFIVWIKGCGHINWSSIRMTRRDCWAQHTAAAGASLKDVIPVLIAPIPKGRK